MDSNFSRRHIGLERGERAVLDTLGFDSFEKLMDAAVPENIRTEASEVSSIPPAASEPETLAQLREYASQNRVTTSMIGLGYYDTFTPSVIKHNVLENPSWYTAYTPYQPEISQGRLEALINYQTALCDLTGLDIANASMLDEATAVVEAMLLARRVSKSESNIFIVDSNLLPQTISLLERRASVLGINVAVMDLVAISRGARIMVPPHFGVVVQYPGADGLVWDPSEIFAQSKEQGAVTISAADLLALTLLKSPGELGADVAVGNTQRFGVPLGFGGPHAGYMAVANGLERQMPGRLVGVSVDAHGRPAYRLTLQTREQHIRRERATSNICTAQVLLAVMASMYAVYHGPKGLRAIATRVNETANRFAKLIRATGYETSESFFDTVLVRAPGKAKQIWERARQAGITLNLINEDTLPVAFDEVNAFGLGPEGLVEAFGCADQDFQKAFGHSRSGFGWQDGKAEGVAVLDGVASSLHRTSEYLTHPNFNKYHSETAMMRYLKRLADKDFALDRGMIPLGSCTMKLNSAVEMAAITWPEFAGIHPFTPAEDVEGYLSLIGDLQTWLAELTGYDDVSLQPNAGSQGELAGLLAIHDYHQSRGDNREVCLIPASAHGTNAASAVLAGMKVVVVATAQDGSVDVDDLAKKIADNAGNVAALMITYPSTHGVFEADIRKICEMVHEEGGQVYIDGANLNALLGYAKFGEIGGDVSHLNLHKTFAIPHGGGGPGVGPVAAKSHLAPFLPGHFAAQREFVEGRNDGAKYQISAAPYGSSSVLPISWAYIRLMGAEGLTEATAAAVGSANYVAKRLGEHYPVLYVGQGGLVAHECILDLRPLKAASGIDNTDVAKRLIDYGFHAPTVSFPVPDTLMVEPTESEDIAELERFINAMISIKKEAEKVADGTWPKDDNPLKNAPHTAYDSSISWDHAYTREEALYPFVESREVAGGHTLEQHDRIAWKYWPPVSRIDQAYGDRNIFCSCPDPSAFV